MKIDHQAQAIGLTTLGRLLLGVNAFLLWIHASLPRTDQLRFVIVLSAVGFLASSLIKQETLIRSRTDEDGLHPVAGGLNGTLLCKLASLCMAMWILLLATRVFGRQLEYWFPPF